MHNAIGYVMYFTCLFEWNDGLLLVCLISLSFQNRGKVTRGEEPPKERAKILHASHDIITHVSKR